jgi:hypothetical protein
VAAAVALGQLSMLYTEVLQAAVTQLEIAEHCSYGIAQRRAASDVQG